MSDVVPSKPEITQVAVPSNVAEQLAAQQDVLDKAKREIINKYEDQRRKIRTFDGDENPQANADANYVQARLMEPLDNLQTEINQLIKSRNGQPLTENEKLNFNTRRQQIVDIATSYIDTVSAESGGITAEVLIKMVQDLNKGASVLVDLMNSGQYLDLLEAFKVGLKCKIDDFPAAEKKAVVDIGNYLNSDFGKGDSGAMKYVWPAMSLLDAKPRLEIAANFCKGKSPEIVDKFLRAGNSYGVFTAEEMKKINIGKEYSKEDLADFANNWKAQNDFKEAAIKLGILPYGTTNAAGEMINIRSAALLFGKFWAGATVVGNFVTGAWTANKFSPGGALKRLVNPQSLGAYAAFAAIEIFESNKTFGEYLNPDDPQKAAKLALKKEKNGNPEWPLWDNYFRQNDFNGGRVFTDYVKTVRKNFKDAPVQELGKYFTAASFLKYLENKANKKDKSDTKDYALLASTFKEIKAENTMNFAMIFDALPLGGASIDAYEEALAVKTPAQPKTKNPA